MLASIIFNTSVRLWIEQPWPFKKNLNVRNVNNSTLLSVRLCVCMVQSGGRSDIVSVLLGIIMWAGGTELNSGILLLPEPSPDFPWCGQIAALFSTTYTSLPSSLFYPRSQSVAWTSLSCGEIFIPDSLTLSLSALYLFNLCCCSPSIALTYSTSTCPGL